MEFMKLDGAVDLHVHSYPCVFQRRVDDREAVKAASEAGMAAIVLKCHHESTVSRAYLIQKEFPDIKVFGGVVMNQFVGGINPAAAEVALRLGAKEVWMPTIDAAHHVEIHGARGSYDTQTSGSDFVWGEPISAVKDGKVVDEALGGAGAHRQARRHPGHRAPLPRRDRAAGEGGPRAGSEEDPHHPSLLPGARGHEPGLPEADDALRRPRASSATAPSRPCGPT